MWCFSRQWKNALYTPILIEYNLRSRGLKNLYNARFDDEEEAVDVIEDSGGSEDEDDRLSNEEEENDEETILIRSNPFLSNRNGSVTSDLSGFGPGRMSPTHFSKLYKKEDVMLLKSGILIDRRNSMDSENGGGGLEKQLHHQLKF